MSHTIPTSAPIQLPAVRQRLAALARSAWCTAGQAEMLEAELHRTGNLPPEGPGAIRACAAVLDHVTVVAGELAGVLGAHDLTMLDRLALDRWRDVCAAADRASAQLRFVLPPAGPPPVELPGVIASGRSTLRRVAVVAAALADQWAA